MKKGVEEQAGFLGRSKELAELGILLESESLVTLVGTAGVGKTRLVREFLVAASEVYQCIFVGLEDLAEQGHVIDRLVGAFGLRPTGRDDLERLQRRVERNDEATLLVVDNAEHLREEVSESISNLRTWQGVKVLVTSREPLGLEGEHVLRLAPLDVDDGAALVQALAAERNVEFEAEHAQALSQMLEGLPLALVLAAEHAVLLSPEQMLERIAKSNQLLSSHLASRHGSLDLALRDAWENLSQEERLLCMDLAYFEHAMDEALVEELWSGSSEALFSLVRRSWLNETVHDSGRRFSMLRAVRLFVVERTPPERRSRQRELLQEWAANHVKKPGAWWIARVREGIAALELFKASGDFRSAAQLLCQLFLAAKHGHQTRALIFQSGEVVQRLRNVADAPEERQLLCSIAIHTCELTMLYPYGGVPSEWSAIAISAATSWSESVLAHVQHARALFDEMRFEDAKVSAAHALKLLRERDNWGSSTARVARWALDVALVLLASGELDLCRSTHELARQAAGDDEPGLARYWAHRAMLSFALGQFADCEEALGRSERLLENVSREERCSCLTTLPAALLTAQGRLAEAEKALECVHELAEAGNHSMHYYYDRACADIAMARNDSARPYLEHAYFELALIDGNRAGMNEASLLLAFCDIFEGQYKEAANRLQKILNSGELLQSVPELRQMVEASINFCRSCLAEGGGAEPPATPFQQAVEAALDSLSDAGEADFEQRLRKMDLGQLFVPGMFFFRFEQQVRAWLHRAPRLGRLLHAKVRRDGRYLWVDGVAVDLSKHASSRKILLELLERSSSEQPTASVRELVEVVWPNSKVDYKIARRRVYSAVNRLRATAAGRLIEQLGSGYAIVEHVQIEWIELRVEPQSFES